MTQVKTKRITISSIVGSAAFQQGVADYMTGRPFNYDGMPPGKAWHYERGRMFAAIMSAKGEPVPPSRHGRRVSGLAIQAYARAEGIL